MIINFNQHLSMCIYLIYCLSLPFSLHILWMEWVGKLIHHILIYPDPVPLWDLKEIPGWYEMKIILLGVNCCWCRFLWPGTGSGPDYEQLMSSVRAVSGYAKYIWFNYGNERVCGNAQGSLKNARERKLETIVRQFKDELHSKKRDLHQELL